MEHRTQDTMKAVEPDDFISFGDWVKQRRLVLDLTRPALARRVNCSPSTIKKIERDERRPSRQIAALLVDQLLIPAQERDRFLRMARGEFVATPLSAPDLVSLPRFLWPCDQPDEVATPCLIAREDELARLGARLAAAMAGDGGILFISGEAGDGKTMLAQAFARQSQEMYPELVVATGSCNAYTGIGDPYLPFREILELLTGDIEAHWGASAMSRAYAQRLWRLVPHTVQALLDAGPDLVGTLLPGAPLRARAMATVPARSEPLLDQLQTLIARNQRTQPATNLQQSDLFSQYTRVLQNLARRQPLLLIIDDLQWVDAGSISLLFHLCRRLKGQCILLVGIYRAAEVALGRNGERHPLEPLLNELQGTFGEIQIRLNQTNGRHFVDALIDCEPNQLDRAFRDALYKQTAGHPLFSVEMLHGLQERGDVVQNDDGLWVESLSLDWHILPARVEGIIKERIGRLAPALQQLLELASVIGETFGAETIAHIQGVEDSQVISQLGGVLEREQRLVTAQGLQRVGPRRLSQYRFRHILFQQYLYNRLSQSQRAYLHRAVAQELEQSYGAETSRIAPQLAHQYVSAGDNARALHYFTVAGNAAAAVYANAEAAAHYRRALDLIETGQDDAHQLPDRRQQFQLYTRLGRVLELSARCDEAIEVYKEMEHAARLHDEQAMVLVALLARAAICTTVNFARDPAVGRTLLNQARSIALALGDRAAEAKILWNLLILSAYTGGDPDERLTYGDEALALARKLELPEQLAFTLHDIFYAYAGTGQWVRARAMLYEARDLWQRLGNLPMLSEAYTRLHWTYLVTGEYVQAVACAEQASLLAGQSHNLDAQALSHFMLGFVYWERGEIGQALTTMEEDIAIAESVRSLTPLTGTRADLGLLYGELGDVARGMELATLARTTAEELVPIVRFWPHAVQVTLHLRQGDVSAAGRLIATLADYQTVKAHYGYMPFMWIRVGLVHGEFALQQHAFDRAVALMNALYMDLCEAGIWYLRPDVLHLKGRALLAQEDPHAAEAHATLTLARAAAETLGSLRALWPILVDLAEVAHRSDDDVGAATLRREAGVIVRCMADHIESSKLRSRFLALAPVKVLLAPE